MNKDTRNNYPSYNYGSTAPADVYPEVHIPHKPQKQNEGRSRKRKQKEKRLIIKNRFKMFLMGFTVFIACICFVWGSAVISHKQYQLKEAKTEVKDLKNEVNTTKAEIALATNLDNVKQRAITELHMLEPLSHQIVYLDMKKSSYTTVDKADIAKN